jgi:predicted secreted protein
MTMKRHVMLLGASLLCSAALAQTPAPQPVQTGGTLVIVPASGEVRHANDEAVLTLMVEEQDKDKAAAASRVNQKMKQGADIVKRQDPAAILQTRGYYTYPVYPEGQPQPRPAGARLQPVGWRVGQYLDVTTTNLAGLPATVAASQKVLALNGLRFGLSSATARKLDQERIAATYLNLNERIAAIARAMGRSQADATLDTLDFEGSGNYLQQDAAPKAMRAAAVQEMQAVEEPSFEPGETTLQMRAVGKVRFR